MILGMFGDAESLDGVITLPGVVADVVAVRNQFVSIYSWTGDGSGKTRDALQLLRTFGGYLDVHDPGEPGTASRAYWEKMQREGLVDAMFDADGGRIEIASAARSRPPSPLQMTDVLAPNGRAVADNFRAWFRSSKVVNSGGAPLVVFHGTTGDFSGFDKAKVGSSCSSDERGFFFVSDPELAAQYASSSSPAIPYETGGNVIPAYVSLQRPLVVDAALLRKEGMAPIGANYDLVTFWDLFQGLCLEWADQKRADGIILVDESSQIAGEPRKMVIAFEPNQIKSAVGNSGNYTPLSKNLADPAPARRVPKLHRTPSTTPAVSPDPAPVDPGMKHFDALESAFIRLARVPHDANELSRFHAAVETCREAIASRTPLLSSQHADSTKAVLSKLLSFGAEFAAEPMLHSLVRQYVDAGYFDLQTPSYRINELCGSDHQYKPCRPIEIAIGRGDAKLLEMLMELGPAGAPDLCLDWVNAQAQAKGKSKLEKGVGWEALVAALAPNAASALAMNVVIQAQGMRAAIADRLATFGAIHEPEVSKSTVVTPRGRQHADAIEEVFMDLSSLGYDAYDTSAPEQFRASLAKCRQHIQNKDPIQPHDYADPTDAIFGYLLRYASGVAKEPEMIDLLQQYMAAGYLNLQTPSYRLNAICGEGHDHKPCRPAEIAVARGDSQLLDLLMSLGGSQKADTCLAWVNAMLKNQGKGQLERGVGWEGLVEALAPNSASALAMTTVVRAQSMRAAIADGMASPEKQVSTHPARRQRL